MGVGFPQYSKRVTDSRRWKALRFQALRRDGFACVQCGVRGRLEVDHVQPVRTHPERAFDLSNLQALCASCHTRKTRVEAGHPPAHPERTKWRDLLKKPTSNEASNA